MEAKERLEVIRTAFEQEFGRFADLRLDGTPLADAEALLREVGELKTRHAGKKSALAEGKKLIGKAAPTDIAG